ncbi:MAG TPA: SusC/RagA family TonB-linked outer membrane protein, partial [Chitinophagaceae bacterium]|nr:SusC/RagA family TonB-linked outer membrane protein [Chitinophagaceae bacterium]
MKLTVLLICLACIGASATGNAQITLRESNASLSKCFKEIQRQSGYDIFYRVDQVERAGKVSVDLTNVTLEQALKAVLKGTQLEYTIADRTVIIKEKDEKRLIVLTSPPIEVKGKVVNEKGEPVEGVTITVKGSGNSTSTNSNGEFLFSKIETDAVLLFSHISMEPQEIKLNGKTELAITLKTKISALGDVVVNVNTGYQSISKERVTGSAFVIDSALFNRTASKDIFSRLEGIAPGLLFVNKSSGEPRIQIRGLSTLGNSGASMNPLIVVDNFPYYDDLDNINPNDVESITILKDAAAASVWGAKAGNGVIVITTKKGKYNQPFSLSLTTSFRVQEKPDLFYYPQMSSSDFIDVEQFLFDKGFYNTDLNNTNNRPIISPVVEILAQQRAGKISSTEATALINGLRNLDVRNDYDKYVYRSRLSRQDYLNFSGGTSTIRYNLSLGFDQEQTAIKDNGNAKRYTINSTTSFKPSRSIEVTLGIGLLQNDTRGGSGVSYPTKSGSGKGAIYPYAQLADAMGNALPVTRDYRTSYIDTVATGKLLDWHYRPLDELKMVDNKIRTNALRLNLGTNIRFTPWLDGSLLVGYVRETGSSNLYSSPELYDVRNVINMFTQINGSVVTRPIPLGGILNTKNTLTTTYNVRGQLNFNRSWNRVHTVSALVAAEMGENKSSGEGARLYGYDKEGLTYATTIDYNTQFPQFLGGGTARIANANEHVEGIITRSINMLANASYSYLGRYTLYVSARKDGANIFGTNTNNKWSPLWSIGTGWDISKEKFYSLSWMSSLKLRASYGYTGNASNEISAVTTLRILNTGGISPYTLTPMSFVASPPNPDLRWEKIGMLNVGVDFALAGKRLSGSIEWYRKVSKDVIASAPVDPTTGMPARTFNYANLEGHGIDITLNSINIDTKKFQWTSSLNFSHNKTIVTKYFGGFVSTTLEHAINPKEGALAFGIYSYKWMGLDPLTGDPRGYLNKQISTDYRAIINDSSENQVFNGSGIPLYYGNLL